MSKQMKEEEVKFRKWKMMADRKMMQFKNQVRSRFCLFKSIFDKNAIKFRETNHIDKIDSSLVPFPHISINFILI